MVRATFRNSSIVLAACEMQIYMIVLVDHGGKTYYL